MAICRKSFDWIRTHTGNVYAEDETIENGYLFDLLSECDPNKPNRRKWLLVAEEALISSYGEEGERIDEIIPLVKSGVNWEKAAMEAEKRKSEYRKNGS